MFSRNKYTPFLDLWGTNKGSSFLLEWIKNAIAYPLHAKGIMQKKKYHITMSSKNVDYTKQCCVSCVHFLDTCCSNINSKTVYLNGICSFFKRIAIKHWYFNCNITYAYKLNTKICYYEYCTINEILKYKDMTTIYRYNTAPLLVT